MQSDSPPGPAPYAQFEPTIEIAPDSNSLTKPPIVHPESHTSHGDVTRDIIIGFADGLTVPFALTAGLSSLGSTHLVVIGGLAELFSGAILLG